MNAAWRRGPGQVFVTWPASGCLTEQGIGLQGLVPQSAAAAAAVWYLVGAQGLCSTVPEEPEAALPIS